MSKCWKSGGVTFAPPYPQSTSLYGASEFNSTRSLADLLRSCGAPQDDQLSCRSLASSLGSSYFPFSSEESKEAPREETIKFFLEDGSSCSLVVEENLRVSDICHLLVLKLNKPKLCSWSVREYIAETGIERILEDDEDLLKVYELWGPDPASSRNKFKFRQDVYKYDFFQNPSHFIPLNMVDLRQHFDYIPDTSDISKQIALHEIVKSCDRNLVVQSYLLCKEPRKQTWKRVFFRLEETILYASASEATEMTRVIDILRYNIYYANENKLPAAATPYSFCLKPIKMMNDDAGEISWLCCESEAQRQGWIIALRLAKHGKKLLENYQEVRARYMGSRSSNKQRRNSSFEGVPLESPEFSGTAARAIPDTKDVIARAEASRWKQQQQLQQQRRVGPSKGSNSPCSSPGPVEDAYDLLCEHPWFYSNMSREEATNALAKYGTVNGVFLVRDSKQNPGCIVLSYVYNNKVHHARIMEVEEQHLQYYSLDNGVTRFFDLLQLVEFYQLNKGCLPTVLAHYLVLPCNEKHDRHA